MYTGGRGRIIAVANRKGGTGKTTTVVNLGAELAGRGHKVLIVDLDPQGHAGLGYGIVAKQSETTVHGLLRERGKFLKSAICGTRVPNLDLIPADRRFDDFPVSPDVRCLARALSPQRAVYDVILIDTPPASASLLICALTASDGVLVPTALEHLSFDGVRQFCHIYDHVVVALQTPLLGLLIVPTRVDFRGNAQKNMMSRLLRCYGRDQVVEGIRIDVAVSEAFEHHQPVLKYRQRTRAVDDYARLAGELLHRFSCPELEPVELC